MPRFYRSCFVVHVDGVRVCLWTAAHNGDSIDSQGEMVRQRKHEELGENPVPVPLCRPQIPNGLTRSRTWSPTVRGRRLAAWDLARSTLGFYHNADKRDRRTIDNVPHPPLKLELYTRGHSVWYVTVVTISGPAYISKQYRCQITWHAIVYLRI
jgi:hypothetical protein